MRFRRELREAVLFLALPAAVVGAVYLSVYAIHDYTQPVGYDAAKYVWRTNLVVAEGLDALPGSAPEPFRVNADRPALPALVGLIATAAGTSPRVVLVVLPAILAVALGLAAGALSLALGEPRWTVPAFVVGVGASIQVSRMAGPAYLDNLLLAPLAVAAAALALTAMEVAPLRGRALLGAVGTLVAGALVHWVFVALFLGVLLGTAALLLPMSLRARLHGVRGWDTPSARLGGIAVAAGAIGGLSLVGLASGEPSPPRLPRTSFLAKLRADLPRYVVPLLAPVAAVGAVDLGLPVGPGSDAGADGEALGRRRRGLALLLMWTASGVVAALTLRVGRAVPAHRFLAFALAVPVLFVAGLVALAQLCRRRGGPLGCLAAMAVLLAGLAAGTLVAYRGWDGTHPWMPRAQVAQSSEAGAYLSTIPDDVPIVFLVDLGGHSPLSSTSLAFHVIRSAIPAELIPRTLIYLGEPDRFLAGEATLRDDPATFDQASLRHWPSVQAVLAQDPVAVMMPAFHTGFAEAVEAHPEWQLGEHVAVVQGPRPVAPVPPAAGAPPPFGTARLVLAAGFVLALLTAAGAGWSAWVGGGHRLGRMALAPAFGLGALALAAVVAGRLGVTVGRVPATALLAAVALAGWAVARWASTPDGRGPGSPQRGSGPQDLAGPDPGAG